MKGKEQRMKNDRMDIHSMVTVERVDERLGFVYYLIRWGLIPVFTLWSVITVGIFLLPYFLRFEMNIVWAVILSIIILSIQEFLKIVGGRKTAQIFIYGWWKDGRRIYAIFAALIMMVAAPAYFSSAWMSISGARHSIDNLTEIAETYTPPQNIASINRQFDLKIESINQQITDLQSDPKSIRYKTREVEQDLIKERKEIEKQRDRELQSARAENAEAKTETNFKKIYFAKWLGALGGIPEVMVMIFISLMCYYEKKLSDEEIQSPTLPANLVSTMSKPTNHQPEQRNQSGQVFPPKAVSISEEKVGEKKTSERNGTERNGTVRTERLERNGTLPTQERNGKNGTVRTERNGKERNGTPRFCDGCGTDISEKRITAKFCSAKCRKENWKVKSN